MSGDKRVEERLMETIKSISRPVSQREFDLGPRGLFACRGKLQPARGAQNQ
jgi:hypothetical protein